MHGELLDQTHLTVLDLHLGYIVNMGYHYLELLSLNLREEHLLSVGIFNQEI